MSSARARGLVDRLRDPSGFGMIEMMIAVTMLAVGVAALGGLFVTGNVTLRRASKQDTATVLADRVLEQMRAIKFSDITLKASLVSAADSTYSGDVALSGTSDITTSGSPCSTTPTPITCQPTRAIPDTTAGETAPDGQKYRIDTYVTWGCPDGTATSGCSSNTYARVRVVTIVVRDATSSTTLAGTPLFRTSTTFDRLSGDSLTTVATAGTLSLVNGAGTGGAYINSSNYASLQVDVALPSTSSSTDLVHLKFSDGTNTVEATPIAGTSGAGTVHFTSIPSLQGLADGTITVSTWTTSTDGDSSVQSTTVTKDTAAPAAPTTLALQNGQGAGGAYINSNNQTTVAATVGLGSTSVNTDTVSVTYSAGGSTTSAGTAAGSTGAGSVTTTGVNASALADGTVTASATVQDAAGNTSAARTATFSKDSVAPAAPTTLTFQNGQGTGNAYINTNNKTSVVTTVGLASTSVTANTVGVTLSDGTTTTTAVTAAGTAGAGTVTMSGVNASSLADGTITFSATATDVAGNASTAKTATYTKDTVVPTITSVTLRNAGGSNVAGKIEKSDQIVIVFSKTMAVSTFCSTWSGDSSSQSISGNGVVVVNLADGTTSNDTMTVTTTSGCTFRFGTIDLGSSLYVTAGSATFSGNSSNASTIAWTASTRTLTITLGAKSGGTVGLVTSSTATYTASSSITGAAGNSISGTGSTGNVKNF